MRDLQQTFDKYREAEEKLSVSESHYRALESFTKTILAQNDPKEGSVKDRETHAMTSSGHVDHLKNLNTAREQYLEDKAQREIWYGQHLVDKLMYK